MGDGTILLLTTTGRKSGKARTGSMNFGGTMSKREPQAILKTDERAIRLELGCEGIHRQIKQLGRKPAFPSGR
jgi:hypothetical protein